MADQNTQLLGLVSELLAEVRALRQLQERIEADSDRRRASAFRVLTRPDADARPGDASVKDGD